ncbi:MAG TPA: hypothetical protein VK175_06200 [Leadbetterella sp.]|nr:hypothetical protein [Leadbetterella sp.]
MFTEDWVQRDNLGQVMAVSIVDDGMVGADDLPVDLNDVLNVCFPPGSAFFDFKSGGGAHGGVWQNDVRVLVPRVSTTLLEWIAVNAERRWVVFVKDANDVKYRIGGQTDGAVLSMDGGMGTTNGYVMNFGHGGGKPVVGVYDGVTLLPEVDDPVYYVNGVWGPLRQQNVAVTGLTDGGLVTHSLNTMKLEVLWYDADKRPVRNIEWQPVSLTQIQAWLPMPDGGSAEFTGEAFFMQRG